MEKGRAMTLPELRAAVGCPESASFEEVQAAVRQKAPGWFGLEPGSALENLRAVGSQRKAEFEQAVAELTQRGVPGHSAKFRMIREELRKWTQRLELLEVLDAADRFTSTLASLQKACTDGKEGTARLALKKLRDLASSHRGIFDDGLEAAEADFGDTVFKSAPPDVRARTAAEAPVVAEARVAPQSSPPPAAGPARTPVVVPGKGPGPGQAIEPPAAAPRAAEPPTPAPVRPTVAVPTPSPEPGRVVLPASAPVAPGHVEVPRVPDAVAPAAAVPAAAPPAVPPTLAQTTLAPSSVTPPPASAQIAAPAAAELAGPKPGPISPPQPAAAPPSEPGRFPSSPAGTDYLSRRPSGVAAKPAGAPASPPKPLAPPTGPIKIAIPKPPREPEHLPRSEARSTPTAASPPAIFIPRAPEPPAETAPPTPLAQPVVAEKQPVPVAPPPAPAPAPEAATSTEPRPPEPLEPEARGVLEPEAPAPLAPLPRSRRWLAFAVRTVLLMAVATAVVWVVQDPPGAKRLLVRIVGPALKPSLDLDLKPSYSVDLGNSLEMRVLASCLSQESYQWFFRPPDARTAQALPGPATNSYSINPAAWTHVGDYWVVVSNQFGAVTSQLARLMVKVPLPRLVRQPAGQTVNQGTAADFTIEVESFSPITIHWQRVGQTGVLGTNLTLRLPPVQPSDEGSYLAVARNRTGATTSQVARLMVRLPPSIRVQPDQKLVSAGDPLDLEVQADGTEPRYQWYFNRQALNDQRDARLHVTSTDPAQQGEYQVVVFNEAGRATSKPVQVDVSIPAPVIETHPANQEVDRGEEAVFAAKVRGWPPLTYQWFRNNQPVAGATSATLRVRDVGPEKAGRYRFEVANRSGKVSSDEAELTVKPPAPPTILAPPMSQTVDVGTEASFSVQARGLQPIAYQWFFKDQPLRGMTNAALRIANAQPRDTGYYLVRLTNKVGTLTSERVRLEVTRRPLEVTVAPASLTAARRANILFTARVVGAGRIALEWYKNNQLLPRETNRTLSLRALTTNDSAKYHVVARNFDEANNPDETKTSAQVVLTVIEPPTMHHVNSLGMRFVSIPGTDLLFCTWETRVADYQAFAKVTGNSGGKASFQQWPEPGLHPVVNVSFDDAKAFCQWLNDKERGSLKQAGLGQYRLPTDAEWSVAAGIANESGATPKERDSKRDTGLYPFTPASWPPPQGAGNYADKKMKDAHADWPEIKEGYADDCAETAPVGRFKANGFGLFDMGGNVREWCEDWGGKDLKVLRGGSYKSYTRDQLQSGTREFADPAKGIDDVGFRVLLTIPVQ